MDNCEGYCKKCRYMLGSLVGLLILIKSLYFPNWLGPQGGWAFIGLLLIVGCVLKSIIPGCSCHHDDACCKTEAPAKAPAKEVKKKK